MEGDGQIQLLQNNGINHSQRTTKKSTSGHRNNNGGNFYLLNSVVGYRVADKVTEGTECSSGHV